MVAPPPASEHKANPHMPTLSARNASPRPAPTGRHGLPVVLPDAVMLGSLASLKTLLTCGRQKATIHCDFIHDCMDAAS